MRRLTPVTSVNLSDKPPNEVSEPGPQQAESKSRSGQVSPPREALAPAEQPTAAAEARSIELQRQLAEEQDRVAEQQQQLAERDRVITNLERALRRADLDRRKLQGALDHSNTVVARLRNSVSWRVTLPIRVASRGAVRAKGWAQAATRAFKKTLHARRDDVVLIEKSGLFDREYYLKQYPEVARSSIDPIVHFLTVGAKEGKNPGPYFDTIYYARQLEQLRSPKEVKD
jgi:hypothetical protein